MTICNKIQTLGETMETNLNARGVSCTFGTGTGESTVLDMVEMVNGTNFKGSSDVNLKIGANRPYLLTGETTDVIVKLENGLCEPLKNKNVIVGQSVFRDGGVTGNTNYTSFYNYATFNPQVDSNGTLLTNNVATNSNYYANLDSTSDLYDFTAPFTVDFDIVSFSGTTIGTQIAERGQSGAIKSFSQLGITQPCHLKLIVTGTQIIYQVDNETVMTQDYTVTKGRVSLILNSATLKYKNFVIYENITGITDGKGEFALYNVSVTDNTIFNATYGTETATCLVEYCSFVDYGVTNNNNLIQWFYAPSYTSPSVDETGTTLTAIREGSFATVSATLTQNPTSTDIYPYSFPLTVEFDLIEWEDNQGTTTDYARIRVYNQADNKVGCWNFNSYGVGHYKVVCTEGSQKLYYNGVEQSRKFTFTPTTAWNVAFQTKGNIKFKNFRIKAL